MTTSRPPPMPGFDHETSHGKVRPPPRPRLTDVAEGTVGVPSGKRGPHGLFATGNRVAEGRGWKAIVRARLRQGIRKGAPGAEDVEQLVGEALLLFAGALRELPNDGQHVRSLLAHKVQHETLAAWWQRQIYERGLGTPESIEAEDRFSLHSRRVEQLTASVLGAAKALASVKVSKRTGKVVPWQVPDDGQ